MTDLGDCEGPGGLDDEDGCPAIATNRIGDMLLCDACLGSETAAAEVVVMPCKPRVEILHIRGDNESCSVFVFVDGVQAEFTYEEIDPGRGGWTYADWDEATDAVRKDAEFSPAFRDHVLEYRADAREFSRYLEGDRDA